VEEAVVIAASDVSAVLVTRGDVDMMPIVESLAEFADVNVWDNSVEPDLAVYGRYAALARCSRDVVLVQDDDVLLPRESILALCAAYEPGVLVANMPQRFRDTGFYDDHCLVGFGALFDRELPRSAFHRFASDPFDGYSNWGWYLPGGERFNRACDIVFSAFTPRKLLDLPYKDRDFASAPNRMWRQPNHVGERTRMLELVRQLA
jgi:hypothetical protein